MTKEFWIKNLVFVETKKIIDVVEEECEVETSEVTQVENSTGAEIPPIVENYIYRGRECDHMSVYEMTMKTEVKRMISADKDKYDNRSKVNDGGSRTNAGYTQKVLFLCGHSKAQSHWISFHRKDKTPVIYGM